MPRKHFRKFLPSHDSIREHRFLSRFSHLKHPNLWHLNRHSVAIGVGVGMFAGLLPPPFQMLTAAVLAVPFRGNLPVAVITTFYTNPFTFLPLYALAYYVGKLIIGGNGDMVPPPEFNWSAIGPSLGASLEWALSLGKPLMIGIATLSLVFALAGWAAVHAGWRLYVVLAWRKRCARRRARVG
jgi:uncharacterized protein (DUF2062 family)